MLRRLVLATTLLSASFAASSADAQSLPPAPGPRVASGFVGAGAHSTRDRMVPPSRASAVRRGAVIGAVVGAGAGALVGLAARCGALKDGIDGDCLSRSSASTIGGAAGGLAGLLVGAAVGALRPLDLRVAGAAPLRVTVAPRGGRAVAVTLARR